MRWGVRFVASVLLALVATATPSVAADPLVYVALGDSYTSGPVVLPHDTRWVPQDCGQSMRNYPHLVSLLIGADRFRDVSCGSATIDDFSAPQEDLPLGNSNRPQYRALNPNVDIVTVGIGGNDVGIAGFAVDCIRLSQQVDSRTPCRDEMLKNGRDEMAARIEAMRHELGDALDTIHRLAPKAKVFVVGYPAALPNNGRGCSPYVPIRNGDVRYLVAKFKEMNRALERAANEHRATYVDIYTSSIGHDACKPPGKAWINGAVLVPPSFPAHPNELSYLHSAPVVARAIQKQLTR